MEDEDTGKPGATVIRRARPEAALVLRRARPHLNSLIEATAAPERVLVVDGPGTYVGKHSERARVSRQHEVLHEAPLLDLDHVIVVGRGVSLSSDLIVACAERGIALDFLTERDEPQAGLLCSALGATVKTRRQQLAAHDDARGAQSVRVFATGKLRNQARLLRYLAKNRRVRLPQAYMTARGAAILVEALARQVETLDGSTADAVRPAVLLLEARGSAAYWQAARALSVTDVAWESRETLGARDPVNSALNYAYKILYAHVQRAIMLAGLDPFGGFLHVDRPGKPSLVLDMVEEFRQMVVDRCIFALFNQRVPITVEDGWLTAESRRLIATRITDRMEAREPYEGKRQALRTIVQSQARHLAAHLRGERASYEPFAGRW